MSTNAGNYVEASPDYPYGWIQWKGTDVCMDVWCACGNHGHIDADFAYFIKCAACGQVYATGQNVRLYPLPAGVQPDNAVVTEHNDAHPIESASPNPEESRK